MTKKYLIDLTTIDLTEETNNIIMNLLSGLPVNDLSEREIKLLEDKLGKDFIKEIKG